MSTLKVDTILKRTGTGTITLGQSGDTIALGSGASQTGFGGANTPSFYAYLNTNQTAGTGADTIITLNAEAFDSDNAFNTTTYKFTPQTAGKYFLYGQARIDSSTDFNMLTTVITLNGTQVARGFNNNDHTNSVNVSTIVALNGSSDYIQMFAMQNSGGDLSFAGSGSQANSGTYLMGYKLIGA